MARVEPGQTQLVRFMLVNEAPLQTERMKRVVFEGLPPTSTDKNSVRLTVRQDLPVLLHPRDLPVEHEPWKRLKWTLSGGVLSVSNPSPYVVRLDQRIGVTAAKTTLVLPKRYILPGERIDLHAGDPHALVGVAAVRLFPASSYGYAVGAYDAAVDVDAAQGLLPATH
jgi:P pilus assembly chaperone PapD